VRLPGAERCIGTRELAEGVERRLGREAFTSPARAEVFLDAHIESVDDGGLPRPSGALPPPKPPGSPGFRARITLSNARGEVLGTRVLESAEPSCRALDEKLVLVLAMLLDPEAALAAGPPPHPMAPAPADPPARPPPPPPPAPPPPRPWRESVSVGPAVAAGLLPGVAVGLSLRGEIVPPAFFPIELGGVVWLDGRATAPSAPTRGATLSLAYGMVGICPLVWGPGATVLRGCADLALGAVRAVGFGFSGSNAAGQEQPVVQAQVAGRVTRRIVGPLDLGIGLGLWVPFQRAQLYYLDAAGNQQELFRTAPVVGVVDASVGLAFP
jgi:hypothetical protein